MGSWYGSKNLLDKISKLGFTATFEGKSSYVFFLNAERFNAAELAEEIRWRSSNQRDIEYARANVISPTFGMSMAHVMGEFRRNVTALVASDGGGMVRLRLWEMINTENTQ